MLSKIVFDLATVCVINATVITVNVFDDDPEVELTSNVSGCNPAACDQLCRRLQFHGGVCVNGRCKCDNFLKTQEEVSENSLIDDFTPLKDNLESELASKKSDCNPQECDQRCRRLKFPGGACVNGRCKCDNFRNAEEEVSENSLTNEEDFSPLIENLEEVSEKSLTNFEDFTPLKENLEPEFGSKKSDCNPQECDQRCRRLKFPGGVCVNGRCKCDNFRNAEEEVSEKSLTNVEDFTPLKENLEPELGSKKSDCNPQECDQRCRRLKFPGGVCVNGRCKCDNFRNAEEEVSEKSLTNFEDLTPLKENLEPELGSKKSDCNPQECDQRCRRLKFPGGVCVHGRCKCDNFRNAEVLEESVPVPKFASILDKLRCNSNVCNKHCGKIGLSGGICKDGICKCNILFKAELPLSVETTSDEQEDSNVLLQRNEEEMMVPLPRACVSANCNQWCRRLNFAGGWCRFGNCQCF